MSQGSHNHPRKWLRLGSALALVLAFLPAPLGSGWATNFEE